MATIHRTDFGFRNDAMSSAHTTNGQPAAASDARMELALNQIRDALRGANRTNREATAQQTGQFLTQRSRIVAGFAAW